MNFIFIIEDFLDDGGVPNEMRQFVAAAAEYAQVYVLTRREKINSEFKDRVPSAVQVLPYTGVSFLDELSRLIRYSGSVMVISCGYTNFHTPFSALWCRIRNVPFVVIPFSQATTYNLGNKLFFEDPDVKALILSSARSSVLLRYFTTRLIVIMKLIFHLLVGKQILIWAKAVGVFSTFEKKQIQYLTHGMVKSFIPFLWGISDLPSITMRQGYYSNVLNSPDSAVNFVYWGRLDFVAKGLDRLLDALRIVKQKGPVPFRIYLMGPDYNGGEEKIRRALLEYNLSELIQIVLRDQYGNAGKQPLIEADASILLSRWDGLPRALRESVSFGVPVLVSPETNFSDIVTAHNLGITVPNADDPSAIADALVLLSDRKRLEIYRSACLIHRDKLLWPGIASAFVKSLEDLV